MKPQFWNHKTDSKLKAKYAAEGYHWKIDYTRGIFLKSEKEFFEIEVGATKDEWQNDRRKRDKLDWDAKARSKKKNVFNIILAFRMFGVYGSTTFEWKLKWATK